MSQGGLREIEVLELRHEVECERLDDAAWALALGVENFGDFRGELGLDAAEGFGGFMLAKILETGLEDAFVEQCAIDLAGG